MSAKSGVSVPLSQAFGADMKYGMLGISNTASVTARYCARARQTAAHIGHPGLVEAESDQ